MLFDRGVHERARLASKRDQQKWNPVLRQIALNGGIGDQQKWNPVLRPIALQGMHSRSAKSGNPVLRTVQQSHSEWRARPDLQRVVGTHHQALKRCSVWRGCLRHRFRWRNEAPRRQVLAAQSLEWHRTAPIECHIPRQSLT
jgi:hypothetical protein